MQDCARQRSYMSIGVAKRDSRLEACHNHEPPGVVSDCGKAALAIKNRLNGKGHKDLWSRQRVCTDEFSRHYTNHGECDAIDLEFASDDVRSAIESRDPVAFTDDCAEAIGISARSIIRL